jgi:hypothetical protein
MKAFTAGPMRWIKRTAIAALLLAFAGARLHAQYEFLYTVYGNYSPNGDGTPFSNALCSDSTPNIFYDNNSATSTPKFPTALCDKIAPSGDNFGVEFFAYMFTWNEGDYWFKVGSADGSRLYVDGIDVLDMLGAHDFMRDSTLVHLGPLTHTFKLDYFASDVDPRGNQKAIQATVDPGLNVTTFDETTRFHGVNTPEPSSIVLLATGCLALAWQRRRRERRRIRLAQPT